jgi:hypothetical protein
MTNIVRRCRGEVEGEGQVGGEELGGVNEGFTPKNARPGSSPGLRHSFFKFFFVGGGGGSLQLADLMPAKWLRSAAQVGSEGIWRQQQPGWPEAFLAVAWVAVGKILPHCSRGNRRLRMACA